MWNIIIQILKWIFSNFIRRFHVVLNILLKGAIFGQRPRTRTKRLFSLFLESNRLRIISILCSSMYPTQCCPYFDEILFCYFFGSIQSWGPFAGDNIVTYHGCKNSARAASIATILLLLMNILKGLENSCKNCGALQAKTQQMWQLCPGTRSVRVPVQVQ